MNIILLLLTVAVELLCMRIILQMTPDLIKKTRLKEHVDVRLAMTALFVIGVTTVFTTVVFGVFGLIAGGTTTYTIHG